MQRTGSSFLSGHKPPFDQSQALIASSLIVARSLAPSNARGDFPVPSFFGEIISSCVSPFNSTRYRPTAQLQSKIGMKIDLMILLFLSIIIVFCSR